MMRWRRFVNNAYVTLEKDISIICFNLAKKQNQGFDEAWFW